MNNDVISIFKMAAAAVHYTSGFGLGDATVLRRPKFVSKPNFGTATKSTPFRFGKLTSAILEFYFRFRFQLYLYNRHVILHQPDKFRRNLVNRGWVMTSYNLFLQKSDWPKFADPSLSPYSAVKCEFKGSRRGLWAGGLIHKCATWLRRPSVCLTPTPSCQPHWRPGASNPSPPWVGDQPPTSDMVKHTSPFFGRTWSSGVTY